MRELKQPGGENARARRRRTPPGVRELKHERGSKNDNSYSRTPPGVRELKRLPQEKVSHANLCRTPPGVRELKLDIEVEQARAR